MESVDKKILIIDDDANFSKALQRIFFFKRKYKAEVLYDAFSVREVIEKNCPDLILMDLRMPGINGGDVCRLIRQDLGYKKIKIIAMSGTVEKEEADEALQAGANHFLYKPFDTEVFLDVVDQMLTQEESCPDLDKDKNPGLGGE